MRRIIGIREAGWTVRRVARQPTASLAAVQTRTASSLQASVSSRTIATSLAEGHLVSWHPIRVLRTIPIHRCLRLEWCQARRDSTATEWNQVIFSDESRFNLSSDGKRVRVGRPRRESLNPALQRHTSTTAGVRIWGATDYDTRSPLILIHDKLTAQRRVYDILQPHVLSLMEGLPRVIFQQDNARSHTARISQDCLNPISSLSCPARSPDFSPIEHIWNH
ncbi:transposable element Tcb2 transposase [Trichonephila clavipes]|uniref:Transposable element Tcb2 transposase n=1 Tax=Trichonephila clavipes TaxID=2585209 RepID=A0A8X6VU55_TRICX|nr:transposable element Tcb2 transposase [Trichonephila clavipes]